MQITIGKHSKLKISVDHLAAYVVCVVLAVLASYQLFGASKDVSGYLLFFNNVTPSYNGRFEPLFVWLTIAIKAVTDNFGVYIGLLTGLSLIVKIGILSKYRHFVFSGVFYLLVLFPLHELTQYRVSIALALLYLSFYWLSVGRSLLLVWIAFLCAVFFHYSSIAFLPIIVGWHYLERPRDLTKLMIVGAIVTLVVLKQLAIYYATELNPTLAGAREGALNLFSSRNIVFCLILGIGLLRWKSIPNAIKPFWFVSLYGFALLLLFLGIPVFGARLFEMTFFSYLVWLSFMRRVWLRGGQLLLMTLAGYLTYMHFFARPLFS